MQPLGTGLQTRQLGQRTACDDLLLDAPVARGHFLGDYMGLAASGPSTTYPVFGIATGKNTTAEFTRAIFDSRMRVLE
jgi:hypothetical protein